MKRRNPRAVIVQLVDNIKVNKVIFGSKSELVPWMTYEELAQRGHK